MQVSPPFPTPFSKLQVVAFEQCVMTRSSRGERRFPVCEGDPVRAFIHPASHSRRPRGPSMPVEALEQRQLLSATLSIGALGDSYTDEYQFYAPDRSTAHNYIEQLADDRRLDFGAFSATSRGTPRNEGFAYNWAQSGDTSADMLADGQLSGLSAQATAG